MARHSTTPLTTDDGCTHHETMLSVGAIHFQDRFCTSKIGGGGWAQSGLAMHMAAVLAGCRKALVGKSWAISLLFNINWCRKAPLLL